MTGRLPTKSLSGPLRKIFANPCLKTKSVAAEVPAEASDFVNVLHARFSSGRATGAERRRPGGRSRHPTAQRVLEAEAQIPAEEEHARHIWGLQGEPLPLAPHQPAPALDQLRRAPPPNVSYVPSPTGVIRDAAYPAEEGSLKVSDQGCFGCREVGESCEGNLLKEKRPA